VRIADVARQLRELRADSAGGESRTLTSVMNLVAWAASAQDSVAIEALADSLSDHHPSRAVIVVAGNEPDGIDAKVELIPQRAPSGRENLLVEQVVLTLHQAVVPHAASAVVPLLRSDLPTFLWWPGTPDPALPQFVGLGRIADRIVVETGRNLRGPAAVERLATIVNGVDAPVTDLAWGVITPWRQLVTGALRGEDLLRARVGTAHLQVTCRPGEAALEALLLGGWLRDILGTHVSAEFCDAPGEEDILGVDVTVDGVPIVSLRRDGANTVSLTCPQCAPRSLPLVTADRRALIAGELELRGHDPVFERAVVRAQVLATA
jgi:glucose-6-phosphate dehydrogenase assembly protein OpcA